MPVTQVGGGNFNGLQPHNPKAVETNEKEGHRRPPRLDANGEVDLNHPNPMEELGPAAFVRTHLGNRLDLTA